MASTLNPLKKLETIAGLAGFVLRLFRTKEQATPWACPPSGGARASSNDPVRILYGSSKAVRKGRAVKKGGLNHGYGRQAG